MGEEQKRIRAVHERLQRWAVWHHTARLTGNARGLTINWDLLRVDCPNIGPDTLISATYQEARETEEVIGALRASPDRDEKRVAQVVIEAYRNREGRSLQQTAGVLGMSRSALHSWLCRADSRIQLELWMRTDLRAQAAQRDAAAVVMRGRLSADVD